MSEPSDAWLKTNKKKQREENIEPRKYIEYMKDRTSKKKQSTMGEWLS